MSYDEGAEGVETSPSVSIFMVDMALLEVVKGLRMVFIRLAIRVSLLSKWYAILSMIDVDIDPSIHDFHQIF